MGEDMGDGMGEEDKDQEFTLAVIMGYPLWSTCGMLLLMHDEYDPTSPVIREESR